MVTSWVIGVFFLILLLGWTWSSWKIFSLLRGLGVCPELPDCSVLPATARSTHSGPTLDFVLIRQSQYGSIPTEADAKDETYSFDSSGSKVREYSQLTLPATRNITPTAK